VAPICQSEYRPIAPEASSQAWESLRPTERNRTEAAASYYRARYYEAQSGRFISEDPINFKSGTNFYLYSRQSPANYGDPFGLYTVQIGGSLSGNVPIAGPLGLGGTVFGGIAFDGHRFAWYWGGGLGPGLGSGISGGVTIGGSNARTVCDLRGLFVDVSGSYGEGVGGGVEGYAGKDSSGHKVVGGNVIIGGGVGASGTLQPTYTWVRPIGSKCGCTN
jgi:RHS repeat-associated protein